MLQLNDTKIVITGSQSMVGKAVYDILWDNYDVDIRCISHDKGLGNGHDLLQYEETMDALHGADYVIHCAGYNGNLGFNAKFPADIYYNTVQMGLNILKASLQLGVKKVVTPLASCAYPDVDILKEIDFFEGAPNDTVEAHGFAKRTILEYSRQLFKQYGLVSVCCIFNTCYGPYDSFDIDKTKVVGGLIKKFIDAKNKKEPYVVCWGSGKPRRELIYVDDAAQGIVNTLLHYEDVNVPLNIGSCNDIRIIELAKNISDIVGYTGDILWDASKPDGQYRKLLDVKRYKILGLPEIKFTTLQKGLEKTIRWYDETIRNKA